MAVLKHQADQGMRMGFSGKQIIHPLQIEVVQAAFSPARREVEWAVRVVVGDEIAGEKGGSGKGAWMLGGRMVDRPVVGRARAVLALARELGVDVDAVVREVASEGKER